MAHTQNGWHLDAARLVLDFYEDGRWTYEVDLEGCTTSAGALDAICQVAGKADGFVSDAALGRFVRLFNDAIRPQESLCSFGVERGPIRDVRALIAAKRAEGEEADALFGHIFARLDDGGAA